METLEEFKILLKSTGLPVAYYAFPEKQAPPLPFICYLVPFTNNFSADGKVYQKINRIQVELYTKLKSPEIEEQVEEALSSFYWEKTETYLEDEKCFEIIYELEVENG